MFSTYQFLSNISPGQLALKSPSPGLKTVWNKAATSETLNRWWSIMIYYDYDGSCGQYKLGVGFWTTESIWFDNFCWIFHVRCFHLFWPSTSARHPKELLQYADLSLYTLQYEYQQIAHLWLLELLTLMMSHIQYGWMIIGQWGPNDPALQALKQCSPHQQWFNMIHLSKS